MGSPGARCHGGTLSWVSRPCLGLPVLHLFLFAYGVLGLGPDGVFALIGSFVPWAKMPKSGLYQGFILNGDGEQGAGRIQVHPGVGVGLGLGLEGRGSLHLTQLLRVPATPSTMSASQNRRDAGSLSLFSSSQHLFCFS